jgi:RimJ/RimL family protein N-acetyltransferase
MAKLMRIAATFLLGQYSIYRIYLFRPADLAETRSLDGDITFTELTLNDIEQSSDARISALGHYRKGRDTKAFGLKRGTDIVAVMFFWFGETYRTRNFWPLRENEAKSVHMFTVPEMRGSGLASALKMRASKAMFDQGFERIYSRIWHSNRPSIRANEKIGAQHVATVIEINPLRLPKPWRFEFHKKHSR